MCILYRVASTLIRLNPVELNMILCGIKLLCGIRYAYCHGATRSIPILPYSITPQPLRRNAGIEVIAVL